MKDWMKKLGALCLTAALSACTLTACTLDDYDENFVDLVVSKPTITAVSYDEKTGLHTILVEGLAQNNTGYFLNSASVWVEVFDELGDPLDNSGYAYISGMDVDEIWHYYALIELDCVPADCEVFAEGVIIY